MAIFKFPVALRPSVAKSLVSAAKVGIRGFATVSSKTAKYLKDNQLTGQLSYTKGGYVLVKSKRISAAVRAGAGGGKSVSLHRLAYFIETGKKLPKFNLKAGIGKIMVVDHKDTIRDNDTKGNLQLITQRENILRISKTTKQRAYAAQSKTLSLRTGGTVQNAAQAGAITKRLLGGKDVFSKIGRKGIRTQIKKRGFIKSSVKGKKYSPEQKALITAKRLATVQKNFGGYKNVAKKAVATTKKKYGNDYFKKLASKGGTASTKKRYAMKAGAK